MGPINRYHCRPVKVVDVPGHQVQQAKHMHPRIYDSFLSDDAVLLLAKYQTGFGGNILLLFMYITTKLSKSTLAFIGERRLKRGLSEEALCKKIGDFNYYVAKFETYITALRLEIASWKLQESYPDLEDHISCKY